MLDFLDALDVAFRQIGSLARARLQRGDVESTWCGAMVCGCSLPGEIKDGVVGQASLSDILDGYYARIVEPESSERLAIRNRDER
jgi:hypothetical protein